MFTWLRRKKPPESPHHSTRDKVASSGLSAELEEKTTKPPGVCPLDSRNAGVTTGPDTARFVLGVWNSNIAISDGEAARIFGQFAEEQGHSEEFNDQVYAFYCHLVQLYPEIDLVPEDQLDACPWACALDMSGAHVIIPMQRNRSAEIVPVVLALANRYGLVCFDPQAHKVHLPARFDSAAQSAGS